MPSKKRKPTAAVEVKKESPAKKTKLASDTVEWVHHGQAPIKGVAPLIFRNDPNSSHSSIVYGFDIDYTLIETKSGAKFAKGASDWKWLFDCIPETLRKLHNEQNIRVMFFTNQAGIEKGHTKVADLVKKCDDIINELGIPVNVYIATGNNHYRKPSCEMWNLMASQHNSSQKLDLSKCMYIGDAAGRVKDWKPGAKKDFSCTDRKFACNIGCKFATPEEFFLKESACVKFEWKSFNPASVASQCTTSYKSAYHKNSKEMVVLCGPPASGKSTFYRRFFEPFGYLHINRDTLGTESKCTKAAEEAMKNGQSLVIDNTHPSAEARTQLVALATHNGYPARCIVMDTPVEIAHHLNFVRQNETQGEVRRIPDVAYNMYKSKYSEPKCTEGFTEVIKVPFYPLFDKYGNKELFQQWTE